jgi:hypothetical protein
MEKILIPYSQAKTLIEEGDVLLFSGTSLVSRLIKRASEGDYSHVGIASWHNGSRKADALLECVEFSEQHGGRSLNMDVYVKNDKRRIDVFRPIPSFSNIEFDHKTLTTTHVKNKFDAKSVTRSMRELTGLPYGWKRILWIAKHKLPILRLFYSVDSIVKDGNGKKDIIYPVCSTSIAHAFSKSGADLVYHRSDEWTEPSDIARSTRLNYLFTLDKDE